MSGVGDKRFRPLPRMMSSLSALWPTLPVWRRLDAAVAVVVGYTAGVVAFEIITGIKPPEVNSVFTIVNTLILGVLLGFRNKEAYDRWWEARTLWGQLINNSRNICLKAADLFTLGPADRAEVRRVAIAFPAALKNHLRHGARLKDVPGFGDDPADPKHVPAYIAGKMYAIVQAARTAGKINDFDAQMIDVQVRSYMDICGACERIRTTPIPLSYRALLRHGTVLYLAITPWLIPNDLGWWAPPVMGVLGYFLLGIELTAEDVEEPFGSDRDDLLLGTYCETIRVTAVQVLPDADDGSAKLPD